MGALKLLAAVAMLAAGGRARAETVADWRRFVTEASQRFGVPVAWIEQVMHAESAGRTVLNGRPIVSRAGAIGLMQLMPETWQAMRTVLHLGRDASDPHDNILAGTFYLRMMHARFGYPGLFAAYNAGPGRYAAYLAGRRPLPGETRIYLARVTGEAATPTKPSARPEPPALFVSVANAGPGAPGPGDPVKPPSLFAISH